MSDSVNMIDASGGGGVLDALGSNVITTGNAATTVTASLGTDTILGAAGSLLVDAGEDFSDVTVLAGSGPLEFIPGSGTNSVLGGSGRVGIESGFQGFEGDLAYTGATGAATVNGYIDTTVTGGTAASGTVLFVQNGPATVVGGTGAVTVYTDGNQLTVQAPDGSQGRTWMPDTHVYLQVTYNGTQLNTVAVNGINGTGGGVVTDVAGSNWITLGGNAATVTAALGADTLEGGTGALTLDALGNAAGLAVYAGSGALSIIPGTGPLQVIGDAGALQVSDGAGHSWNWTGPAGDTLLFGRDGPGDIQATDEQTLETYTFTGDGIVTSTTTVTGGAASAASLLAGEQNNAFYGAMQAQLGAILPPSDQLVSFAAGQPVPQGQGIVTRWVSPSVGGIAATVPSGVPLVLNQSSAAHIQGNGAGGQFVVSTVPFIYHSNGGSGVVLADDVQAGGAAGGSIVALPPSGGGNFIVDTGSGNDTVVASSGNDTIAAGGGANLIYLGNGADLVRSAGMDTVVSGSGAATVDATAGVRGLIFGGTGPLSFVGGAGAATVVAGSGRTSLVGGPGNDVFWGSGAGFTTMQGGTGGATLVGGAGGNVIYAGGAQDQLLVAGTSGSTLSGAAASGNNFFWGSNGDDSITAGRGQDTVIGGSGRETLQAGSGGTLIFGGSGGDTFVAGDALNETQIIAGGGAPSTFVFIDGSAGGEELVWGFRPGVDHISLQGYAPGELQNATASARPYGVGTELTLSDGTTLILGDVAPLRGISLA